MIPDFRKKVAFKKIPRFCPPPTRGPSGKSNIQGVTGGTDQTSGECSLGQTIPIYPKTPISKVERLRR